ncbi:hypothetical protein FGB62_137g24 [Gracilaria domingensis]|nr:hypothetical protein FGB62_137g24 [Gracilaria domingensis]
MRLPVHPDKVMRIQLLSFHRTGDRKRVDVARTGGGRIRIISNATVRILTSACTRPRVGFEDAPATAARYPMGLAGHPRLDDSGFAHRAGGLRAAPLVPIGWPPRGPQRSMERTRVYRPRTADRAAKNQPRGAGAILSSAPSSRRSNVIDHPVGEAGRSPMGYERSRVERERATEDTNSEGEHHQLDE